MKVINVRGPDGNVFCILGCATNFQRQLRKEGITNDVLDLTLDKFSEMNYDDILDNLEETGLFKFTGRK